MTRKSAALTSLPSYYDPAVEFLELGTAVLGQQTTWKLYGPASMAGSMAA